MEINEETSGNGDVEDSVDADDPTASGDEKQPEDSELVSVS